LLFLDVYLPKNEEISSLNQDGDEMRNKYSNPVNNTQFAISSRRNPRLIGSIWNKNALQDEMTNVINVQVATCRVLEFWVTQ
jgi:hypothetical protein